jgi:2-keto-4-pentenoate hydratase/2-oxohepta-3-ene-1,7-dioic acid hydratase in catechol pathway
MLDPEVEMGLVVLDDLRREDGFPRYIGLILVNDFSDRKRLVQNSDPNSDEPCTGCTEGKSREKYLPIGNLLVIPRDFEAFYPQIELRLYVNQQLRQKAPVGELTLKPRQIIDTVWDNADALYDYNGKKVPLLSNFDVIQRGSIILTGTPAGVVFSPPTFRQIMAGLPGYIFSFDWSNRSPLEGYFKGAEESGAFLQKGDQVISSADYLGILYQTIYP